MPAKTPPASEKGLQYAEVSWDDNGQPLSSTFEDFYFSTESGIEEKTSIFLAGNQLETRFSALTSMQPFVIGETGFGTGLSFLCAWRLFEQVAPKGCQLHFISSECHPLRHDDLAKALALWPELAAFSTQLLDCYLPASNGFHHFSFESGRIRLTLLLGNAPDMLTQLHARVDAWFLDGFSPARNPALWQPALFTTLAEKSADNATYATFSSARLVRDGLTHAGFSVHKTRGFGLKRDTLFGQLEKQATSRSTVPVWHQYPVHRARDKTAVVIGGGLAGTSCARSLAERGWQVTLLERHDRLATEASGNLQGILYAKLSANETLLSRLIAQGYCYTLNRIKQLDTIAPGLQHACGVVQLCTSDKVRQRHQALTEQFPPEFLQLLSKDQLSDIAGLPVDHEGLYFPEAGWVDPRQLCRVMVDHPNITIKTHTAIDALEKSEQGWQLLFKGNTVLTSETVVIAGGVSTPHWTQLSHIPLKGIRGQTTRIGATESSARLKTVVCGTGYIAPTIGTEHTLGATFDFQSQSLVVSESDHQKNLSMQANWFSAFSTAAGGENVAIKGGKAGFRCTTPDYLPAVGPIIDKTRFLTDFAVLRKNSKHPFTQPPVFLEGLYITAGHGSRGLITCPLAGEILASMINNEPSPVATDLVHGLNPSRFLVRDLSRDKI